MRYFATASGPLVREAMRAGWLGQIITPASGNRLTGTQWCADNAVYGNKYPGDAKYLRWLDRRAYAAADCAFAVAPDVVGDAAGTLARSQPMFDRIRDRGFPVALAAQNGLENMLVPWDDFDVLFIGGDTEWKLGDEAWRLTLEAGHRGKPVHMGRVNSLRRLRVARRMGCTSVDGTYLAYGPAKNLPQLATWLAEMWLSPPPRRTHHQPALI